MVVWFGGMFATIAAVSGVVNVIPKLSLAVGVEILVLATLVMLSQWTWRVTIQRHFRTADLV
jgi:hypothetical protein